MGLSTRDTCCAATKDTCCAAIKGVRRASLVLLGLGLVSAILSMTPTAAQHGSIWMLKFEHKPFERVAIGREPSIENYWVLPFTLTNTDDKEHRYFLDISMSAENDKTLRCIDQPQVFEVIRKRLSIREDERLLTLADWTTAHAETGLPPSFPTELKLPKIAARETLRAVAIFPAWDTGVNHPVITVRGLTNDVRLERTGRAHERELTTRVLKLEYYWPGDELHPYEDALEFVSETWAQVRELVKTDLE